MRKKAYGSAGRAVSWMFAIGAAVCLSACVSETPKKTSDAGSSAGKEYFPESVYGKASPRVTSARTRLPRGGGREQIGKPYMVAGKMYYPREEKNYTKVGKASWYGNAFHGRLTANGEIYDMTHLTAAHPTMPLPSYARVTNLKDGSSVIVRVNDRGPYASGRIIDLSRRAAELLDYTHSGVAQVKVEYVGRAPLEGDDDSYLMASYHPGNRAPDPSDGLPTGVMVAMNGPTPSTPVAAFPGQMRDVTPAGTAIAFNAPAAAGASLPDFGPIFPDRPADWAAQGQTQIAMATYYAAEPRQRASRAFAALERDAGAIGQQADDGPASATPATPYIAAGTFTDRHAAGDLARRLAALGKVSIERSDVAGTAWFAVNLRVSGETSIDSALASAWRSGAPDALVVRD